MYLCIPGDQHGADGDSEGDCRELENEVLCFFTHLEHLLSHVSLQPLVFYDQLLLLLS